MRAEGRDQPLGSAAPLERRRSIDRAERIVGMMGPEPLPGGARSRRAGDPRRPQHRSGAVGGARDASRHAAGAVVVRRQDARVRVQRGAAEEARLPARRRSSRDYVEVEPLESGAALHAAFGRGAGAAREREPRHPQGARRPARHHRRARSKPHSERAVRVSGMKWTPQPYTIKLEGAEKRRLQRDHVRGHARSAADRPDRRVPEDGARVGRHQGRRLRRLARASTSSCCASTARTA